MNKEFNQFIGKFENALSQELCNEIIDYFNFVEQETSFVIPRQEPGVQDSQIFLSDFYRDQPFYVDKLNRNISGRFYNILNESLAHYRNRYEILNHISKMCSFDIKLQKIQPGQGFHFWHCEAFDRRSSTRLLAFQVYLNDILEGGETEFVFQDIKIQPKTGTLLLYPAGFTHTHRGNSPTNETKYIITGWIELV